MDKHKGEDWALHDGFKSKAIKKRRHTWTGSPEQDLNLVKKQRHFSAGNTGSNNEPDLIGSIMSGMTSPKAGTSGWEGQPRELGKKEQKEKWENRITHGIPQNQWWSKDPLQLESYDTFDPSLDKEQVKPFQKSRKAQQSANIVLEREKMQAKSRSLDYCPNNLKSDGKKNDKSDGKKNDRTQAKKEKGKGLKVVNGKKLDSKKENKGKLINFSKESRREKEKMLENTNGGGNNLAENTAKLSIKNVEDNKKFPREMEGTKSWKGKSSWNGSRRLRSTRRKWRPDRAYDFGRNDMEINDRETPNDQFDLARIV